MSAAVDIEAFGGTDPVLSIAEDLFASMVDAEPGTLRPWDGPAPAIASEIHAWVDVHGPSAGRVLLTTEETTAEDLARALLGLEPGDDVSDADLVDALGEVANVVGGNVKALVVDPHALSLPVVDRTEPRGDVGDLLHRLTLDWRGRLLVLSLWSLR